MLRIYFATALFAMLAWLPAQVSAQNISINGNVVGQNNEPLIGVVVTVKGTQIGVATDIDGNYSISIPSDVNKPKLEFSYVGYETFTAEVGAQKTIDVQMNENEIMLEDIVVIGYGTVRRQDLTGAVSSPDMTDVLKAPVASVDEALAGRIAGVQITSTEGQPGGDINIVIRGSNSITQSSKPLYVVDGFPIEDFNMNTINPSDIKSIDVLKDASSSAIYGARGANGVIMITTHGGSKGATKVVYSGTVGWQDVISHMDVMDPYNFVLLQKEINNSMYRDNYLKPDSQGRDTRSIDYYKNVPYIDWQEMAFQNALLQNHSISVSGGSDQTQLSVSFNYMDQEGVVITSGFERYSGRIRIDHKIRDFLEIGANASYSETNSYGATVRNTSMNFTSDLTAMYNLWGYRPMSADKSIEDYLNDTVDEELHGGMYGNRVNPIKTLQSEERNYTNYGLNANAYVNIDITPYLMLRSTIGLDRRQSKNEIYYGEGHPATMLTGGAAKGINGSAEYLTSTQVLNENTLTYTKTFNKKHNLSAMGGVTINNANLTRFKGEAWHILRDLGITALDESDGATQPLVSSKTENGLFSVLGRVQYNYNHKYYLTTSIRRDASSRFPTNNNAGYFPSAAVMYRISEESFIKPIKQISNIALRTSYGETGNDRTKGNYDYLPQLEIFSSKGFSWGNGAITQGAESTTIGNSNLKWETTKTWDVGLNLSFLDNRIGLDVDYYNKKTEDLLMNAKMPSSSGYNSAMRNIGSVQNTGWEFTLNTENIITKNFRWSSSFNISFNRSKVLSLADDEPYLLTSLNWSNTYGGVPLYIAKVGQPIGMFYGMRWVGNYQIEDFTWQNNSDKGIPHEQREYKLKDNVPSNGLVREQIKPGYIKYADMTNPELNSIDADDRTIIGDPNPKFTGGFSNNFVYKDFDLNLFFQFSYGNEVMNANRLLFEGTYRYGLNQFASYIDRWSPQNAASRNHVPGGGGNSYYSDRTIEDASFLRLKTVQFGYNLPKKVAKNIYMSDVRFFVSAQNLFTWTKYTGFDPEVSIYSSSLTPGFDYLSYPRSKTYTIGANITF